MTTLPRGREFTPADLAAMPDDGNRYELIDGALIVTPSPVTRHQVAVGELHLLLRLACPDSLRVLMAPLDVTISSNTVMQPDLLVAPRDSFLVEGLAGAPLLAVEVLSPSTRHIDLGLKRSRYEAAGCASYWVLDAAAPSIVAWELEDGAYVEVGRAVADEALVVARPFALTLVPRDLVN
ncbi:MAG: Uma2 family endonuclease [Nocardioides sp.]